jgi:GNAT superfamily N-acetyltransferase
MSDVLIREFQPGDEAAFRALNVEWIERYFRLEPPDEVLLSDPQSAILAPGGRIFLAVRDGVPIGCCALLFVQEGDYELGKMAVAPAAQGQGIGRALLTSVIDAARAAGIRRLSLETNHVLTPAIRLYESCGFRHIPEERIHPSSYTRCDVAMELLLSAIPS